MNYPNIYCTKLDGRFLVKLPIFELLLSRKTEIGMRKSLVTNNTNEFDLIMQYFYPMVLNFLSVFNIPTIAKVIWRRGHIFKSHQTDLRSLWNLSLPPLVYICQQFITTPWWLLMLYRVIRSSDIVTITIVRSMILP